MKKLFGLYFFLLPFIYACRSPARPESEKPLIVGTWKEIDLKRPSDAEFRGTLFYREEGYTFMENGRVDTKFGFFEKREWGTPGGFLGIMTDYRIKRDSLEIFDPSDSTWYKRRIIKLDKNALILGVGKDGVQTFARKEYNLDDKPTYDKIVLSSSGCYGTCPIQNIIISSDGELIFFGERYVTKKGYYSTHISKEQYKQLEDKFRMADVRKLNDNYAVGHTDDETITTTFIKDNKIVKSIEDYGEAGPAELVWAYVPLRYLYESTKLDTLPRPNLPFYLDLHGFNFQTKTKVLDLSQSESFLLWDLLRKGKATTAEFKPRFKLKYYRNYTWFTPPGEHDPDPYNSGAEDKVNSIDTDGRYYRFNIRGYQPVTIDLGFNFYEDNFKGRAFRKKSEYDE